MDLIALITYPLSPAADRDGSRREAADPGMMALKQAGEKPLGPCWQVQGILEPDLSLGSFDILNVHVLERKNDLRYFNIFFNEI